MFVYTRLVRSCHVSLIKIEKQTKSFPKKNIQISLFKGLRSQQFEGIASQF